MAIDTWTTLTTVIEILIKSKSPMQPIVIRTVTRLQAIRRNYERYS